MKNCLPYYKAYPRDFIEGTVGLGFETKCAYRVVLDLIYLHGGELPDDPRYISGVLACSVRKWKTIREELLEKHKLKLQRGFISNFRADFELEMSRKYQDKQAENRRGPNKNNDLQKPRSNQPEPEPEPEPEKKERTPLYPPSFENWWSVYPRKVGKGAAAKAYRKAMEKVDEETLALIARRYAGERAGQDEQYTVHPATWLNQERWLDEPAKPTDRASSPAQQRAQQQSDLDWQIAQRLDRAGDRSRRTAVITPTDGDGDHGAGEAARSLHAVCEDDAAGRAGGVSRQVGEGAIIPARGLRARGV